MSATRDELLQEANRLIDQASGGAALVAGIEFVTAVVAYLRQSPLPSEAANSNAGCFNSGNCNTGSCNTGGRNTGDLNTGYSNTGNSNTGSLNTGARNTGHYNTGDRNTGDRNTGHRNTGDFNTGDRNTGFFCTQTPNPTFFDQPWSGTWPEAYGLVPYLNLPGPTVWVETKDMSEEEKAASPTHQTTGGYLKQDPRPLTQTFPEVWSKMSEEEKQKWLDLPNFDAEKFLRITGVDVRSLFEAPTGEATQGRQRLRRLLHNRE